MGLGATETAGKSGAAMRAHGPASGGSIRLGGKEKRVGAGLYGMAYRGLRVPWRLGTTEGGQRDKSPYLTTAL